MAIVNLGDLVLEAKLMSDSQNTNTIAPDEWIGYVNFGIKKYWNAVNQVLQDYNLIESYFWTNNGQQDYPLPEDFMYVRGVDCSFSPADAITSPQNVWVSLKPYQFAERAFYTYPRFWGTAGSFIPCYHIQSTYIRFLPVPVQALQIRFSYIPVAPLMATDEDSMNGYNGFETYIAAWAAFRALQKQELDTTEVKLMISEWENVIRVQANERNRDVGPRLTDVNTTFWW